MFVELLGTLITETHAKVHNALIVYVEGATQVVQTCRNSFGM